MKPSCEPVAIDLTSHHALGSGSYVFRKDFSAYLMTLLSQRLPPQRVEVNFILQPNSSPHIGTLCNIVLTFVIAQKIAARGIDTVVVCDIWDNAKGTSLVRIDGVEYQKGLRDAEMLDDHLPEYVSLFQELSQKLGVVHRMRFEQEFLSQPGISEIVAGILKDRHRLMELLTPATKALGLRAACPECALVDKQGSNNIYADDGLSVSFLCPEHGRWTLDVESQSHLFHFNCQLFNLVLGRFYTNVDFGYVQVCGMDYAGFWQEQLLWRHLQKPIIIVYTPLIVDWSGSKISKSLYLRGSAYDYIDTAGQGYLVDFRVFRSEKRDLSVLCHEVDLWVIEPYRLFRPYSLHYMHLLFTSRHDPVALGITHK